MQTKTKAVASAAALLFAFAAGAVSSAGPSPTETPEYIALASSTSETEADMQAQLAALQTDHDRQARRADAAESSFAEAQAEAKRLRDTYAPEIRAEREAAVQAEVARACTEATENVSRSITSIVKYEADWDAVSSRTEVVAAVENCSAAERAKTEAERLADELAACETIDVDAVVKNPDRYLGDCFVIHVAIWQFDSRTGPCSFLAAMSNRSHRYRYQYDDDGAFIATDEVCPQLDDIDSEDFVKIWAIGAGPYSYDTAVGGSNEIPLWAIKKVELVRKG